MVTVAGKGECDSLSVINRALMTIAKVGVIVVI